MRCNVAQLEAGAWSEIVLDYEVGSSGIADGGWLKATFKFYSDWALFQTSDPGAANYISAEYHAASPVPGQAGHRAALNVRFDQKGHERPFQKAVIVDVVDGYVNAGDRIVIRLGDRRRGPGTRVQTFAEDNFRFRLYVDPLGTSRFVAVPGEHLDRHPCRRTFRRTPERPALRAARHARALPAIAAGPLGQCVPRRRRHRARRRIRRAAKPSTDASTRCPMPARDLRGRRPAGRCRHAAHRGRRPRPPGRARGRNVAHERRVAACARAWYADLHVHAHDTVGTNSPAYNARYARDIGGIDVLGYTANDFQITDENWQLGVDAVEQFNDPGRFVVYPVQEWCGSSTAGGDHNVVFLGDARPDFPYNARGEHNRTLVWNEDMKGNAIDRPLARRGTGMRMRTMPRIIW